MSWAITCREKGCGKKSTSANIDDLVKKRRRQNGQFKCNHCGGVGVIEKGFDLQEPGKRWEPDLHALLPLGDESDTYQPYLFVASRERNGHATDVWFGYYKDMRAGGGRLKAGHGPGGPPVLGFGGFLNALNFLVREGYLSRDRVLASLPE